ISPSPFGVAAGRVRVDPRELLLKMSKLHMRLRGNENVQTLKVPPHSRGTWSRHRSILSQLRPDTGDLIGPVEKLTNSLALLEATPNCLFPRRHSGAVI